ncbi:MAG: hypothetical protein UV54_C0012G0011, partial [Candidatus Beckwithbacteria bacterium GW2011_GWA2_43_10]
AKFVGFAGIEKDPFGGGGFAGINMSDNADVADFIQRHVALFGGV